MGWGTPPHLALLWLCWLQGDVDSGLPGSECGGGQVATSSQQKPQLPLGTADQHSCLHLGSRRKPSAAPCPVPGLWRSHCLQSPGRPPQATCEAGGLPSRRIPAMGISYPGCACLKLEPIVRTTSLALQPQRTQFGGLVSVSRHQPAEAIKSWGFQACPSPPC